MGELPAESDVGGEKNEEREWAAVSRRARASRRGGAAAPAIGWAGGPRHTARNSSGELARQTPACGCTY